MERAFFRTGTPSDAHDSIVDRGGARTDADLYLSYANQKNRMNYAFTLFQFRNDYYIYAASTNANYKSRIYRGVEVRGSYPFSKFKRFEVGVRGQSISSKEYQVYSYESNDVGADSTQYFALPFIALVTDNVLYGSTGPINGGRSRFSLEYAAGDISYVTGVADIRKYWNIRHRYNVAGRLIVGGSRGEENEHFRVGGPFTFRGVDWGEMRGTRLAVANLEFRYPFIDELRFGWPLPLALRGIGGILFVDGATVWDNNGQDIAPIKNVEPDGNGDYADVVAWSYGFGARVNLGFFILRWDYGQLTDFKRNLGSPFRFLTIASDF